MNRTKLVSRNIAWGLIYKIISIIFPFIIRTVMIQTLGTMYLGLNGLFSAVIHVLSISELGISSAIIFSMYKPIAEENRDEVCALLNLYKKCYRVIGVIVLTLGLALIPFIKSFIHGDIPQDTNIYILYLLYLLNTFFTYELYAYKSSLLIAAQRNDAVSKISIISYTIQSVLQLLALVIWRDYYCYIVIMLLSTASNGVMANYVSKKLYPQYICKGNILPEKLEEIKKKVGGMLFQKIGAVVLSSVDTLVISAFLGLNVLAIYQNYYYIITALFGICTIITDSLKSTVGNSIAVESEKKNFQDFKIINFIFIWLVTWSACCLGCLYQPFMELWVGRNFLLADSLIILFSLYFFVHKWCDIFYVYQEASGIWWENRMVPLIAAITNLCVNLLLVQIIGLAGILLSTIISVFFIYDLGYAYVLFKCYFKTQNLGRFLGRQCIYLGTAVVTYAISAVICQRILFSPLIQIILRMIVCCIIPNVILWVFWHRSVEFKGVKALMKRIVKQQICKRETI